MVSIEKPYNDSNNFWEFANFNQKMSLVTATVMYVASPVYRLWQCMSDRPKFSLHYRGKHEHKTVMHIFRATS